MWLRVHAVAGSAAVAIGFWVLWGDLPVIAPLVLTAALVGFLLWAARDVGTVWAWATFLLGIESLTWPVLTMIRARIVTAQPIEEQMFAVLTAVLFGLFSSVFWLTFSYGLFKRARQGSGGPG